MITEFQRLKEEEHKQLGWYQLYYRDKINETMAQESEWKEELGKKIKIPTFC